MDGSRAGVGRSARSSRPPAAQGGPQANLSSECGAAEPDQGRLTTRLQVYRPGSLMRLRVAFHGAFGRTLVACPDRQQCSLSFGVVTFAAAHAHRRQWLAKALQCCGKLHDKQCTLLSLVPGVCSKLLDV